MKKLMPCCVLVALLASFGAVQAAPIADQINDKITSGDYAGLQSIVKGDPSTADTIVRALLTSTQNSMTAQPETATKSITTAAGFAEQITPPSVPAICADVRKIVSNLPIGSVGTPLFTAVLNASETFSKAPVVVASGSPNLCEEASDDAQLAQQPGLTPPSIPSFITKPSGE